MAGYTPIYDFIIDQYRIGQHAGGRGLSGYAVASVFGVVWRFCQMDKSDPRCEASADRIAARIGLSGATARAALQLLTNDGYLLRTARAGSTPIYRLSAKAKMETGRNGKETESVSAIVEVRDGPG